MKKNYITPLSEVYTLSLRRSLLNASFTEDTGGATGMSDGSFGARRGSDFDDDEY